MRNRQVLKTATITSPDGATCSKLVLSTILINFTQSNDITPGSVILKHYFGYSNVMGEVENHSGPEKCNYQLVTHTYCILSTYKYTCIVV